jgi:hypothetical protein
MRLAVCRLIVTGHESLRNLTRRLPGDALPRFNSIREEEEYNEAYIRDGNRGVARNRDILPPL